MPVGVRPHTTRAGTFLEPLEGRTHLAATVVGTVQNLYPAADGSPVTTPLALWRVYADANGNGALDAGEPSAVTGLDGSYALQVPAGTHVLRAQHKSGWAPASTAVAVADRANVIAPTLTTWMTNPVVVDVATLYTDPSLPWGAMVASYFRTANQVLANSDTNVRLNLVGTRQIAYTPANNLNVDLARLSGRSDGYMDSVHTLRDQLGADIVVLFNPNDQAGTGLAYLTTPRPNSAYGFAVCGYTGNAEFDAYILTHEIGHTLGADHDADHGPGSTPSYARGSRFVAADGTMYHDVMAYPPGTTLPFFSSPNIWYAGQPLGNAQSADNARAIRQTAPLVAQYRPSRAPAPSRPVNAPPPPAAAPVVKPASVVSSVVTKLKRMRVVAGQKVTATAVVRNESATKFTGRVRVAYYLSADKFLDSTDQLLRTFAVTARDVRPDGTIRVPARLQIPGDKAAGRYFVLSTATSTTEPKSGAVATAPLKVATALAKKKLVFQTTRRIG